MWQGVGPSGQGAAPMHMWLAPGVVLQRTHKRSTVLGVLYGTSPGYSTAAASAACSARRGTPRCDGTRRHTRRAEGCSTTLSCVSTPRVLEYSRVWSTPGERGATPHSQRWKRALTIRRRSTDEASRFLALTSATSAAAAATRSIAASCAHPIFGHEERFSPTAENALVFGCGYKTAPTGVRGGSLLGHHRAHYRATRGETFGHPVQFCFKTAGKRVL
jgi:hypothetical protein